MRMTEGGVSFDGYDMPFIRKNGLLEAAHVAEGFYSSHPPYFPFLHDVEQLSGLFQLNRKRLFDMMRGAEEHYRPIELKKKNGGTRLLHEPDRKLKQIQHTILRDILMKFSPSPYAKAYVRRRTLTDNAAPHVGRRLSSEAGYRRFLRQHTLRPGLRRGVRPGTFSPAGGRDAH